MEAAEARQFVEGSARVLVLGAGGLGCEMLARMAMCGVSQLEIVDMDTVAVSNVSRQFLFREEDVGGDKAQLAAAAVQARFPAARVAFRKTRIESLPPEYYRQFHVILCGLDSVGARRWMNGVLCALDEPIPLVDGGTEGLMGHARIIVPGYTPCVECTLDLFGGAEAFAQCTLAGTPTRPEHCVAWAVEVGWPRANGGVVFDAGQPAHLAQVCALAARRAAEHAVIGVTRAFVEDSLVRIVPAVATTTAFVASWCCHLARQLLANAHPRASSANFWFYSGDGPTHVQEHTLERRADCWACAARSHITDYRRV